MLQFEKEQKRFEIGKITIGGIPGKHPTVLVGSIFYDGDKLVNDANTGEFDKREAERFINLQEEFADKTGNPCCVDVVGSTPESIYKYLDFVADVTDAPLFIDGVSEGPRLAGLEYAANAGLTDRIVYNSLSPSYTEQELQGIKQAKIKSAILLGYNMRDFTSQGRFDAIQNLLTVAEEAEITKPLGDTCVLDIPSLGQACLAISKLKSDMGIPAGCGAHNAIDSWRGLKTKMGTQATDPSMSAVAVLTVSAGANFILYGPIQNASYMFPSVAVVDAALAQVAMERREKIDRSHPRYKIA